MPAEWGTATLAEAPETASVDRGWDVAWAGSSGSSGQLVAQPGASVKEFQPIMVGNAAHSSSVMAGSGQEARDGLIP